MTQAVSFAHIKAVGIERCLARLNKVVERRAPDECWPCRTAIGTQGYGRLRFRDFSIGAHRLTWMIANDCDPGALLVCHSCDNRPCCNPAHLWLGTDFDNHADMVAKGRRANMSRARRRLRGPKLSADQIDAIRRDNRPRPVIAAEYGISVPHVGRIRGGRAWTGQLHKRPRGRPRPRGQQHHSSRLTAEQALAIYRDSRSNTKIAAAYGISSGSVFGIKCGRSWRQVTGHSRPVAHRSMSAACGTGPHGERN